MPVGNAGRIKTLMSMQCNQGCIATTAASRCSERIVAQADALSEISSPVISSNPDVQTKAARERGRAPEIPLHLPY